MLALFDGAAPTPEALLEIAPERLREAGLFFLERPDVLPGGDLGIRRALQVAYELDELPTPAEVERIGEPWRPHRSLASIYLWESLAATPA